MFLKRCRLVCLWMGNRWVEKVVLAVEGQLVFYTCRFFFSFKQDRDKVLSRRGTFLFTCLTSGRPF